MLEGLWIFSSVHNNNALFKCKQKITDQKGNNGATDVEIIWGILEMLLLAWEIRIILTISTNCFIIFDHVSNQLPTFTITYTKRFVPLVTLSTLVTFH